jgi:hypothetical protein
MLADRAAKLAIPIIALAILLSSARGQVAVGSFGMPTYVLKGIMVGTAPDGTQYKSVIWAINVAAGDWSYTHMATIDPTAVNPTTGQATGWVVQNTNVSANGTVFSPGAWWNGGPNMNGAVRYVVSGYPDNTIPVQVWNVQIWSAVGYAITAVVEHLDASGNPIEPPIALTDPQLLIPSVSTSFTLGLDDPTATEVVVRNTGSTAANVTFAAYDPNPSSTNRTPFATATVQISAGGKQCRLVSDIFAGNADFAAALANPDLSNGTGFVQGVLTVSADQPISVNTILFSTKSDGSLLSTVWDAFPSVPTTASLSAVYGFAPASNAWTKGTAVAGTYLILFGAFAASGNSVAVDGTVLPPSAVLYQGTGQINITLANLSLTAGNHSVLVAANGSASTPAWFVVTQQ